MVAVRIVFIPLLLLGLVALCAGSAHAQVPPGTREFVCPDYARVAVMQQAANLHHSCGFAGPEWSEDYAYHLNWCMNLSPAHAGQIAQGSVYRANALLSCNVQPQCNLTMDVVVALEKIRVIDEADGAGNAEPFLWPLFFRIEAPAGPNPRLATQIFQTNGIHENLGTNHGDGWNAGQTILIPEMIGTWRSTLRGPPLFAKGGTLIGTVTVLLEEDHFPSDAVIAQGYYAFGRIFNSYLDQYGALLPVAAQNDRVATSLEETLTNRLKSILSGPADIDDVIGVEFRVLEWEQLESTPAQRFYVKWDPSTGSEDGAFEMWYRVEAVTDCTLPR